MEPKLLARGKFSLYIVQMYHAWMTQSSAVRLRTDGATFGGTKVTSRLTAHGGQHRQISCSDL